jgi:sortase B
MEHKRHPAATAVQILLGAGVACCAVWLGARVLQRAQARQSYDTLAAVCLTPRASATGEDAEDAALAGAGLTVDFAALTAACPAAAGWLTLDDLDISYPVMHGDDNTFYLTHGPTGAAMSGGSLFLDSANASPEDAHALIYGHHMQDGSMFGTLDQYAEESFYRAGTDCFTLYLPDGARRYQIFAVQRVEPTADIFTVGFAHDDAFDRFLQEIQSNALYDTGVSVTSADQVLSLATCATVSGEGRLVVSAKYIGAA